MTRPVPGLARVVAVLCLTEIVSWGVLFYAFPVLASSISADEDWPTVWLVAAFTLALVVSGGCGIWVGHRIDHAGPRRVMTAGSVLAVASVLALAAAPRTDTSDISDHTLEPDCLSFLAMLRP